MERLFIQLTLMTGFVLAYYKHKCPYFFETFLLNVTHIDIMTVSMNVSTKIIYEYSNPKIP